MSFKNIKFYLTIVVCIFIKINIGITQCNQDYFWAVWTNFTGNSATGTITTNNQTVDVTMTANYTFDSTPNIFNYGAFSGFSGNLPPNATVPRTTWAAGQGGETTMCFSETVSNPVLLISSLGNPNTIVTLTFSRSYITIFDGGGMSYPNDVTLIGQEGYAIIVFPGEFDCITIYSSTPEFYTNITWGLNTPLFEIELTGEPMACDSTVITASGGTTYNWSGGLNPNSAINTFIESGVYFITVTDDIGCTVISSVTIDIFPAEFENQEESICEGDTYFFNGQPLTQAGQYEAVFQTINGCDSTVTLNLEVHPVQNDFYSIQICEGESYEFNGLMLNETGNYSAELQNQWGCDSTINLLLEVYPNSNETYDVVICEGDSYEFDGMDLTETGQYSSFGQNQWGCDSTTILNLEVYPNSEHTTNLKICEGDSIEFNGNYIKLAGSYTAEFTNQWGCDSIVILMLEVFPTSELMTFEKICLGDSIQFNGNYIKQAGTYTAEFTNQSGCDSIIILNLEIAPISLDTLHQNICMGETYNFNGEIISQQGMYSDTFQNQLGCDSIITLNLFILPTEYTPLSVQICEGQTYNFNGQNLGIQGTYVANLQTSSGCDSLVELELSVVSILETQIALRLCPNAQTEFGGMIISEAGVYQDTLISFGGCDSLVTLTLTFYPEDGSEFTANICEGGTYEFDGQILSIGGEYQATFQNIFGCDSTVTLNLLILSNDFTNIQRQICEGDTYLFGGVQLSSSGNYLDTLQNTNSCDSIISLTLTVSATLETYLQVSICEGESLQFGGIALTEEGEYIDTLKSSGGCDSLIKLQLSIKETQTNLIEVDICEGESYEFDGELLTESGEYTVIKQSVAGCDSIIILKLLSFDAFEQIEIIESCDVYFWPQNGQLYTSSGIYTIPLQSIHGCDSIYRLYLSIHPSFQFEETIETFHSYTWQVNNLKYFQSGIIEALFKTVEGCDSLHKLNLIINPRSKLFVPSAFSPNGDGINDKFTIYGDEYLERIEELTIYDRWGNRLANYTDFPPNDTNYGWDGRRRGIELNPGVFIYTARVRFVDGDSTFLKGEVTKTK
jgi:gliding motility-associated-like protein